MARRGVAPLYMVSLDLEELPVLVVGGGEVAVRKVTTLLESRARVTVVSPAFHPEFKTIASGAGSRLRRLRRRFRFSDLSRQRLVFASTDNLELNRSIADHCKAKGIFVNVAAPPEAGDFQVPATVRRGQFALAVSTGGASASLSAYWRKKLEKLAPPEWGEFVALLEERRERLLSAMPDAALRREVFRGLSQPKWLGRIRRDGATAAGAAMDTWIARKARSAGKGEG